MKFAHYPDQRWEGRCRTKRRNLCIEVLDFQGTKELVVYTTDDKTVADLRETVFRRLVDSGQDLQGCQLLRLPAESLLHGHVSLREALSDDSDVVQVRVVHLLLKRLLSEDPWAAWSGASQPASCQR